MSDNGVSDEDIQEAHLVPSHLASAPFLFRLQHYLNGLRSLVKGRFQRVVLLFDEFDKLLESYRSGYRADTEQLLNELRRAATEDPNLGLVLAGSDLMQVILGHYRSAMYGSATSMKLLGFSEGETLAAAREIIAPKLVRTHREFSDSVIRLVVRITGGHPLYMRQIGCACALLTKRRHVTEGTVMTSVKALLRGEILAGDIPDFPNTVTQPLQSLKLMESRSDELVGRLALCQLARHVRLERPQVPWITVSGDDQLLAVRPAGTWNRIRDKLKDADLIYPNKKRLWAFRFPIIAEAMRMEADYQVEKLIADLESLSPEQRR